MHFVIEGKPNISKFVQVIKLFSHSLFICDQDKMLFLDMKQNERFNEVGNARNPAYFALLKKEMFYDYQTQIRENHLKFAESSCSNIQLQQEICLLNSQLKYICCELPTNLISKTLKPFLRTRIKQLTMSFSYLLDEKKSEKRIILSMIINLFSDVGTFQIVKPIQQLNSKNIEMPFLDKKLFTIDYENCQTILTQLNNEQMRIICNVDGIHILTLENSQQIDIPSTQIDFYNSSFVEELFGELKIDFIYGKTYKPILSFCLKIKEKCTIYITPAQENYGLIYFTNQDENMLICCRQAILINKSQEQQGLLFQQLSQEDNNILEEIEIISKQQISQNQSQKQLQTTFPEQNQYSNSFFNEINNSKVNNSITFEQQLGLFVPPKVTGSVNDEILNFMQRKQPKQTDYTISKFT